MINGAPAVGKSGLAPRYADDHPLALVIDVDLLRAHLGGWQSNDESKLVARELAIDLARAHLARGHDVVVPQFIGRPEFLERLRAVADEAGVEFVEVVLTDNAQRIAERFRRRRAEYSGSTARHPEYDIADSAIDRFVADANEGLLRDAAARGATVIDASRGHEAAYEELRARIT